MDRVLAFLFRIQCVSQTLSKAKIASDFFRIFSLLLLLLLLKQLQQQNVYKIDWVSSHYIWNGVAKLIYLNVNFTC